MTDPANLQLQRYGEALADGIERALPAWVERSVTEIAEAWRPGLGTQLRDAARQAGVEAASVVGSEVRDLLQRDVDRQATNPLAIVRTAVRFPTRVLSDAGVPSVVRDAFEERALPDDLYGLAPAAFADLDPALQELGLAWGAAKAHVVLARRRAAGLR